MDEHTTNKLVDGDVGRLFMVIDGDNRGCC